MTRRCTLMPYEFDQKKNFNGLDGTRATDLYHAIGQHRAEWIKRKTMEEVRCKTDHRKFRELQGKLSDEDKEKLEMHLKRFGETERQTGGQRLRKVAGFEYELAEDTRDKAAKVLQCEPKNVFFANSATCAAVPIFMGFLDACAREANGQLEMNRLMQQLFYFSAAYQYPTLLALFAPENIKRRYLKKYLTRQNYGYRSAPLRAIVRPLRAMLPKRATAPDTDIRTMYDVTRVMRPFFELMELLKDGKISRYNDEKERVEEHALMQTNHRLILIEHLDRMTGRVYMKRVFDEIKKECGQLPATPLIFLDGSHTFGTMDYAVPSLCNAYVAGSSKGLGAEPTIGIGYVNNNIFERIASILGATNPPFIAGQFSEKTGLGVKRDDVEKTRWWISLPELASMNAALTDLLNTGIERVQKKLSYLRNYAAHALLTMGNETFKPYIYSTPLSGIIDEMIVPITELITSKPQVQGKTMDQNSEKPFLQDAPGHLTAIAKIRKGNAKTMARKLKQWGIRVGYLHEFVRSMGNVDDIIRLSFRHDIHSEQDIDHLVTALDVEVNEL